MVMRERTLELRSEGVGEEQAVRAVVQAAFVGEPVVAELVDTLRRSPDWVPGLSFVAELPDSVRAANGFGSTGRR